MANTILFTSSGTYTTVITSSNMTGLTTGSGALSTTPITNNRDQYAHFELQMASTGALASGDNVSAYFIVAADGTNYEDGTSSVTPAKAPDMIFPLRAITNGSQRVVQRNVPLPFGSFKTLVINNTSTAFSTATNVLSYLPSDDQIQAT